MLDPGKRGPIAALVAGILALAYFYRGFVFSGFNFVQGDEADGRLTSFIATHWLDPQRWGSWQDLGMFYPLTETLGFSDWLFLNGLLSIPFAALGVPDFAAFQWALIAMSAIGYASMVVLLRNGPRLGWPLTIAASLVFVFGNNMYVASEHPQLAPISLLPLVALLGLLAWRFPRRMWVWSIVCGLLVGLILITSFYTFWYLLLVVGVTVLVAAIYPASRRRLLGAWRKLVKLLVGVAVGVLPFVLLAAPIYLAALDLGEGQRSTADILYWSLSPKDFVNVSSANAVWGWFIDLLYPATQDWRSRPSEWAYAPTPLVWIGVAFALAIAVRFRHRLSVWGNAAVVLLISGVIFEALLLRIGPYFPWSLVVHLPGATAIRALGRLQLVSSLFLIVAIAILTDIWWRSRSRTPGISAVAGIALTLVVLEQVNLSPMQENGPERRSDLAAISAPPGECATFVVIRPLYPDDPSPPTQLDAMVLSRATGVKTMHGYTGIEPPGWNLTNSWESDYRSRVADRIAQFNAAGVTCGVDLANGEWLSPEDLQAWIGSGS